LFRIIVSEILGKCYDNTLKHIEWFLQAEQDVFTLNEHYFSDYKGKFLAYYRGARRWGENSSFMHMLQTTNGHAANTPISRIINAYHELGINGVSAADLPKILEADPDEPALEIMADVRAYFQGDAYPYIQLYRIT
jgi:hypothetical protein